ncbi:2409_t:CDS:10, partial [Gigaspora margarita]
TIEELFTNAASLRISQHQRGDDRYKGAHNLKEDCQTLARFFNDITDFKNAKVKLTKFNNQEEFEKNKQDLLNKVNQALSGLQMKTGGNSSVDDFADYVDMIIGDFRREVEALKADIEQVAYSEAKELQKLNQEERKLQKEIEENERKAQNEPDPEKKKKFLFLAVLERKQQLKSSSLGDNFDPDKHINDFIQAIKDKLKNKPPKRNPTTPTDPNNVNLPGGSTTPKPFDPFTPTPNSNPNNFFQENKQLTIITGVALLIFFYFYSQPSKKQELSLILIALTTLLIISIYYLTQKEKPEPRELTEKNCDNNMVNILGKELEKEQEQQLKIIALLLIAGLFFYFNVYLPNQQRQQLEMQIQTDINTLQTIQPTEYEREGNAIQQEALENMKEELDKAVNEQQKLAESNGHGLLELDEKTKKNNLEDNYGFTREENGEIRYILFVDEADNVCSNTALPTEYTKLIFLKACMEGIKKDAQSQNLWIFATNYLKLIDPPVYRPGDFKKEADRVGILNQKFINHPETKKQLPEIKKENATKQHPAQSGIKIGEIKQLPHFYGKYEKPKKPTTDEIMPTITEAIDTRLKELTEQLKQTKEEMSLQRNHLGVVAACGGLGFVGGKVAESAFDGGGDDSDIDNKLRAIINDPNKSEEEKNTARKRLVILEGENRKLKDTLRNLNDKIKNKENSTPTPPSAPLGLSLPKLSAYDKIAYIREGRNEPNGFGGVIGMKNALKKIKAISDLKEQQKEAERHEEPYGLGEYDRLLKELKSLAKSNQDQNNSSSKKCFNCQENIISAWGVKQDYCSIKCCFQPGISSLSTGINNHLNSLDSNLKPYAEIIKYCLEQRIKELTSQSSFDNTSSNEVSCEEISCEQCFKEIESGKFYYYHKTNDSHKFCSSQCYNEYYGEYCDKCVKKFLTTYRNGNSNYCSTCYELVKQGEREEEKRSIRYCKYCSTKLIKEGNLKYSLRICDKDECLLKLDKELYPEKYSDKITTLETNSNKTPQQEQDLTNKKQKLKELEDKVEELDQQLPLTTQIANLQQEIKQLTNKPTRTKAEEALLAEKKKKLEELLKKQNSSHTNNSGKGDKTALYIGCGVVVKNIQEYLNQNYSDKKNTKEIVFGSKTLKLKEKGELVIFDYSNLEEVYVAGELDVENITKVTVRNCPQLKEINITDFVDNKELEIINCPNLKKICCSKNQLTKLDLNNLQKLICYNNQLTNLDFLKNLTSRRLEALSLANNNFSVQDLSFLTSYTNLEVLDLGNCEQEKINQDIYNKLNGSLDFLNEMKKLKKLYIDNTDFNKVNPGKLPNSLEEIHHSAKERPVTTRDYYFADYLKNEKNLKKAEFTKEQTKDKKEFEDLRNRYNEHGLCQKCQNPNTGSNPDTGIKGGFEDDLFSPNVALKSLKDSQNTTSFLQEVANHKLVEDDNIVKCHGISQDPTTNDYLMVMQYVKGGNLRQYLQENYNELKFGDKLNQLRGIVKGLVSIHERGLVHKDLHSGNILSNEEKESVAEKFSESLILPSVSSRVTSMAGVATREKVETVKNFIPYAKHQSPKLNKLNLPRYNKLINCYITDLGLYDNPLLRPPVVHLNKSFDDWYRDNDNKDTEFYRQRKKEERKSLSSIYKSFSKTYQIHPQAVYVSRLLDFKNLPEPQSSKEINKQSLNSIKYSQFFQDSGLIDLEIPIKLDQLDVLEEQTEKQIEAQIQIPPK